MFWNGIKMDKKGWFHESARHSLARKGIKTKAGKFKTVSYNVKYYGELGNVKQKLFPTEEAAKKWIAKNGKVLVR